jgi:micrococcal nuclease
VGHVIPHHVFQLPGHYLVVEVPDGDSIVILAGDRYESVQMRNIQTPNRNKPGYAQAGAYLRERILDETIQLEFEEEQPRRDFFGRYVAYVVHEGQVMNIEMVRQGFSAFEEEAGESQYAELFQEAEAQARVDKLGRWSTPPFANPPKSVLE